MKVFISADIEGTAVTATREGCRPGEFEYERSRKEMTAEVVAAAEGARAAGAELVVVKDAHGPGLNILPEELPEYVQLIRSWSGSPEMMVEGLDSSFDAAFFVGYANLWALDQRRGQAPSKGSFSESRFCIIYGLIELLIYL